jgi:predicted transcriptional regulator
MQLVTTPAVTYNDNIMITPRQVRLARIALGLSQQELAELAHTSRNTVSAIESGRLDPRVSTLRRIVQALEDAGIEFTSGEGVRRRGA